MKPFASLLDIEWAALTLVTPDYPVVKYLPYAEKVRCAFYREGVRCVAVMELRNGEPTWSDVVEVSDGAAFESH